LDQRQPCASFCAKNSFLAPTRLTCIDWNADKPAIEISQQGKAGMPVTIRAAEGAKVIFKRPDTKQNPINLAGCQHIIIRDLEIIGGGAGIRIRRKGPNLAKFI
jgi:hypothetical protein